MEMVVRRPGSEDRAEWTRRRVALWPETSAQTHAEEVAAFLSENLTGWLAGLHAVGGWQAPTLPLVFGCSGQNLGPHDLGPVPRMARDRRNRWYRGLGGEWRQQCGACPQNRPLPGSAARMASLATA
jgi:hypothetical protein